MPRAMLHNGAIILLEPLPPEWEEGTELEIEAVCGPEMTPEEIDRSFAELEELCSRGDPADAERLETALREADLLAKEQMRREMGLPG